MQIISRTATLISLGLVGTLLSACGGASSSKSFDELFALGEVLSDETFVLPYTDPTTLPTSGSATYDGVLGIGISDTEGAIGELELTASFADLDIDGDVTNIVDSENNRISGQLQIDNGSIDRTADTNVEFTFAADIGGNLTSDGAALEVDGVLVGDFTGPDYEYVEGFVDGTVTVDGVPSVIVDGLFYAER